MGIVCWYKVIVIFAVSFQWLQYYNSKHLFYIEQSTRKRRNGEIIVMQIYTDIENIKDVENYEKWHILHVLWSIHDQISLHLSLW